MCANNSDRFSVNGGARDRTYSQYWDVKPYPTRDDFATPALDRPKYEHLVVVGVRPTPLIAMGASIYVTMLCARASSVYHDRASYPWLRKSNPGRELQALQGRRVPPVKGGDRVQWRS